MVRREFILYFLLNNLNLIVLNFTLKGSSVTNNDEDLCIETLTKYFYNFKRILLSNLLNI